MAIALAQAASSRSWPYFWSIAGSPYKNDKPVPLRIVKIEDNQ